MIMFNVLVVDDGNQLIIDKSNYVTHTVTC